VSIHIRDYQPSITGEQRYNPLLKKTGVTVYTGFDRGCDWMLTEILILKIQNRKYFVDTDST
jgi:hypothetical protein